jgi:hypothetical protein
VAPAAPATLRYRVHTDDGDSIRLVTASSPDAEWTELEFARPSAGDRMDVESCTQKSCTLAFMPKTGPALWLDVDRKTRMPTSVQWIAHDTVESCDHLAFTRDRSAIQSATCTRIVDRVGEETETWTLLE